MIEIILTSALALIIAWSLVSPFFRRDIVPGEPSEARLAQHTQSDLDFDFATGKLSEEDYKLLKKQD